MDNLPLLHELSSDQKDALIILLWEENQALKKQVALLQAQVVSLQAQINDLTQRLNSNSQNSHNPPSSDGFKRVKVKREKSNKKTGGQTGHKGHALQRSNNPDYIVEHPVETCSNCKSNIKDAIPLGYKIAQVYEIPLLKVQVTEHRIFEKVCPCCGEICSAQLPEGVVFGLQYGNRLRSFLIYLHHYHYLSSDRISEFFSDVFNHSISEGVVFISEEEAFINLEQFEYTAKELLKKEKLLHADETSLRVDNHKEWLHVLSSTNLTQYFIHQKRGKIATDEMGVLPFFKGILVHDHWKPYFQYECEHALCNAHHLRELRAVSEGTNHLWAEEMTYEIASNLIYLNFNKALSLLSSGNISHENINKILNVGIKILMENGRVAEAIRFDLQKFNTVTFPLIEAMFNKGLIDEIKKLLSDQYQSTLYDLISEAKDNNDLFELLYDIPGQPDPDSDYDEYTFDAGDEADFEAFHNQW